MSELVINDKQMCTEEEQTYKVEQYPEREVYLFGDQHSNTNNNNAILVNAGSIVEVKWANQMYTRHKGESKGSAEDYRGSMSSLTVSTLTSGYETYKPESPKDDLDVVDLLDDCSLFELESDTEYPNALSTQNDHSLYRDQLSSEVSEQQIPSVSRNENEWPPFNALITTDENRLSCSTICPEDSQSLFLSAQSVDLPANEEKSTNSTHLKVTRTNKRSVAFRSEDWKDFKTLCLCNKDNVQLDGYKENMKNHRTENGHAGGKVSKIKQVQSHTFSGYLFFFYIYKCYLNCFSFDWLNLSCYFISML